MGQGGRGRWPRKEKLSQAVGASVSRQFQASFQPGSMDCASGCLKFAGFRPGTPPKPEALEPGQTAAGSLMQHPKKKLHLSVPLTVHGPDSLLGLQYPQSAGGDTLGLQCPQYPHSAGGDTPGAPVPPVPSFRRQGTGLGLQYRTRSVPGPQSGKLGGLNTLPSALT